MGIEDLAPDLLLALGKKRRTGNLNDYSGKVLGVDCSVWIMKALRSREHGSDIARLLSIVPRVSSFSTTDRFGQVRLKFAASPL